ncbi:hypothetical protein GUJ93_ZPchr0005g15133 [Zizania palustris]|uniref:PWWP domain-containing protein n=1 Tax=Zizania palustris TaxID=103762 RepID=A0A8J5VQB3_ZIZPA|nr:hypothetical protein GUJ93_ZPchr0005g15133 [Zizania palustris]
MASPEKGAAAHGAAIKNGGAGQGSTVSRPGRLRVVHPDVAAFLLSFRRLRTKKQAAATPSPVDEVEELPGERVRYDCAFEDEGVEGQRGFAPPRLVWGKVKSHPWWPGQVFGPADASELALQHPRKSSATLVAFFSDKTFAWVDLEELRPFRGDFACLAGQRPMPAFAAAVDAALDEVTRRVGAGLSCCCTAGSNAVSKKQVIDNAGVRDGAYGAVVDAAFTRDAFRAEAFVGYISALAVAPFAGADRLDLAIAKAQLEAINRWRGPRNLTEYTSHSGIEAKEAEPARGKRRRGSRESATSGSVDDALELENFEPSPQPLSHQMFTKVGKLMSRAAQQMSQSPVIHRGADVDAPPSTSHTMARCTRAADVSPSLKKNGCLKDDLSLAGLVLNFICPSAVLPTCDLVKIFSQFGQIMEAKTENSYALVMFKNRADAEAAFSGTAKISALSSSLISFRLTYSMSTSSIDPSERLLNTHQDHLTF